MRGNTEVKRSTFFMGTAKRGTKKKNTTVTHEIEEVEVLSGYSEHKVRKGQ